IFNNKLSNFLLFIVAESFSRSVCNGEKDIFVRFRRIISNAFYTHFSSLFCNCCHHYQIGEATWSELLATSGLELSYCTFPYLPSPETPNCSLDFQPPLEHLSAIRILASLYFYMSCTFY